MTALAQPNQEPVPARGVAHRPVVDVGEGRGAGHAGDEQQDEDLDDGFGAVLGLAAVMGYRRPSAAGLPGG